MKILNPQISYINNSEKEINIPVDFLKIIFTQGFTASSDTTTDGSPFTYSNQSIDRVEFKFNRGNDPELDSIQLKDIKTFIFNDGIGTHSIMCGVTNKMNIRENGINKTLLVIFPHPEAIDNYIPGGQTVTDLTKDNFTDTITGWDAKNANGKVIFSYKDKAVVDTKIDKISHELIDTNKLRTTINQTDGSIKVSNNLELPSTDVNITSPSNTLTISKKVNGGELDFNIDTNIIVNSDSLDVTNPTPNTLGINLKSQAKDSAVNVIRGAFDVKIDNQTIIKAKDGTLSAVGGSGTGTLNDVDITSTDDTVIVNSKTRGPDSIKFDLSAKGSVVPINDTNGWVGRVSTTPINGRVAIIDVTGVYGLNASTDSQLRAGDSIIDDQGKGLYKVIAVSSPNYSVELVSNVGGSAGGEPKFDEAFQNTPTAVVVKKSALSVDAIEDITGISGIDPLLIESNTQLWLQSPKILLDGTTTVSQDPVAGAEVATKRYVDAQVGNKYSGSGLIDVNNDTHVISTNTKYLHVSDRLLIWDTMNQFMDDINIAGSVLLGDIFWNGIVTDNKRINFRDETQFRESVYDKNGNEILGGGGSGGVTSFNKQKGDVRLVPDEETLGHSLQITQMSGSTTDVGIHVNIDPASDNGLELRDHGLWAPQQGSSPSGKVSTLDVTDKILWYPTSTNIQTGPLFKAILIGNVLTVQFDIKNGLRDITSEEIGNISAVLHLPQFPQGAQFVQASTDIIEDSTKIQYELMIEGDGTIHYAIRKSDSGDTLNGIHCSLTTQIYPYDWVAGGSSGGTTNYNDLTNKPTLNGIELTDNKTIGINSGDISIPYTYTPDFDYVSSINKLTKKILIVQDTEGGTPTIEVKTDPIGTISLGANINPNSDNGLIRTPQGMFVKVPHFITMAQGSAGPTGTIVPIQTNDILQYTTYVTISDTISITDKSGEHYGIILKTDSKTTLVYMCG